uniref:ABC1 atypical kinase-like domain-containing protein n=1 Tax=Prymnesium polylepis TaxID=72548 RepID=A0A7S4HDG2_9EUKA
MTDDELRTNITAAWVRDGLLNLGPTMIKLGQVFSSRKDLLHPAYCEALESLQTAVPCVSGSRVRELLEAELGTPLPFDSFDDTPLAGASLGQVHRAVYKGTPVAVKIQRAGLKNMFDTDFKNIRLGCRVMNACEHGYEKIRRWQGKDKAAADRDWMEYANDAARLLYEEIDYINEGKNAEAFAESLVGTGSNVVVPKVFTDVTTERVLTMEYIESVKMTDKAKVAKLGLDTKALSQQVLDTFLMQLLTTGVLHCDPHPGNMCVTPSGQIVLYDFGMMDTLPQTTVQGMRKIAFGLLNGSPEPSKKEITTRGDSVMEGLEMAGFLAADANKTAVRLVGEFLVQFFSDQAAGRATQDVTEQIDYELRSLLGCGAIAFPSAFTFVARAFTSVDGIAKSLRPDYELREAVEPFVGQLISDEYSSQAKAKRDALLEQAKGWLQAGEAGEDGAPLVSSRDAALVAAGLAAGVAITQVLQAAGQ